MSQRASLSEDKVLYVNRSTMTHSERLRRGLCSIIFSLMRPYPEIIVPFDDGKSLQTELDMVTREIYV